MDAIDKRDKSSPRDSQKILQAQVSSYFPSADALSIFSHQASIYYDFLQIYNTFQSFLTIDEK